MRHLNINVSRQILPHRFFSKFVRSTNDLQAQQSGFYCICPIIVSEVLSKARIRAILSKDKLRMLNPRQLFQSISHRIRCILMETNNLLCSMLFIFFLILSFIFHHVSFWFPKIILNIKLRKAVFSKVEQKLTPIYIYISHTYTYSSNFWYTFEIQALYTFAYIYTCKYIYIYICRCIYIYIYVHVYVVMYRYIYIYM